MDTDVHGLNCCGDWLALTRCARLLRITVDQRRQDGRGQDETILDFHMRPFSDGLRVIHASLRIESRRAGNLVAGITPYPMRRNPR